MKKFFIAWGFAAFFLGVTTLAAATQLKVSEINVPAAVSPGQTVAANVVFEVLELAPPAYLRPFASYHLSESKIGKNISANQMTPWRLTDFKVGDKLKVTANFTIPENARVGEKGFVSFKVLHNGKSLKLQGNIRQGFTVKSAPRAELETADKVIPSAAVLQIPTLKTAPVIDGKADEKIWQQAAFAPVQFNSASGAPADNPAELRIYTDHKNLYIAARALKVDPAAVNKVKFNRKDAPVWNNDALEIFLTPDMGNGDYTQFIADLLDQHYDSLNGDFHGFNPPWQSAARCDDDSWTIEAVIPLDAVSSEKISDGTIWRAGFFRLDRKGTHNSAWVAPLGTHNGVKKHGYIIFGTLKDALNKAAGFATVNREKTQSEEMKKLVAEVQAVCNNPASCQAAGFVPALTQLSRLKEKYTKLQFAERFAASKSPVIVQYASPYDHGLISGGNGNTAVSINADFYAGEVQDIALNLTNISDKTITLRAGFFNVNFNEFEFNRKNLHYFYQGIDNYQAEFFDPTAVAAADGTLTADVLTPNPAGVWRLAPKETRQIFISVLAPEKKLTGEGVFVVKSIDNSGFEPIVIPVKFAVVADKLAVERKPITTGWDFLPTEVKMRREKYASQQYNMLHKYGFNMTMLSGLRHFPRPRADKQGNIVEKLDFSVLHQHVAMIGTLFDHYYFDVSVWEKNRQRKDLFGLDFYDPAFARAFKTWFAASVDELAKLGISNERLVVCPLDEALDGRAQKIAGWIKEVRPETRIIVDTSSSDMDEVKRMDKFTDIWMPHMKTLPQEALQDFHEYLTRKNKPRLLYYYCTGGNEKLKKPYGEYICNFFRVFASNFGGLGYWAAGQYYGDPWYRKAYQGAYDTSLIYPSESGPIPSRRLAAWRRGTQDLWLLRTAEAVLQKDPAARAKLRQAAQLAAEYPNDQQRGEELRKYCRQIIGSR